MTLALGTKDPVAGALSGATLARMTTALPVPLSGDELRVPCLDGGQRRYLSFDTAAATGALQTVLDAVQAFTPWYAGVQGRAGYKSQASAIAYESARLAALTFAGRGTSADDAAVFCGNATEAIRQLAGRLRLSRDDVVVTTLAEHRANLLPWSRAATCRPVGCGRDGTFGPDDVAAALDQRPRPALLAITGASGITGWAPPLPEIIDAAHRRGVPVLADVAQLAPHRPLPAGADFLVWSGHKMYAPFGIGVLTGPRRVLTEKEQEADGSPNVIGAVALHAAMDALAGLGWPVIGAHEELIATSMRRGLAAIPGVRVLGPAGGTLPIVTFTVAGVRPALVTARLAAEHAIGAGRLGADPYLARLLGPGRAEAVRVSAGIGTSGDDVRRLLAAVAEVAAGDAAVPYHEDTSTGDFFPAAGRAA
jgi:selenocysteine lyase/cysteine desulfurase